MVGMSPALKAAATAALSMCGDGLLFGAAQAEETPKLKESLAKISDMRPGTAEVGRRGC